MLADFEMACEKDLAAVKTLARIGPILGLMGTLIPMGPALVGLASGDGVAGAEYAGGLRHHGGGPAGGRHRVLLQPDQDPLVRIGPCPISSIYAVIKDYSP